MIIKRRFIIYLFKTFICFNHSIRYCILSEGNHRGTRTTIQARYPNKVFIHVHQKRMSTSSTERRFNRIRNSARENNKPILPVILNLTLPTVNHQKFGNNTKRTVKNQKTKNVTFSMNKRHFHFIHCKMKTLKICCH